MSEPTILVADAGGTNTRVALADGFSVRGDTLREFRNRDEADAGRGLDDVLAGYLKDRGESGQLAGACVAVAGPVRGGEGRLTNIGWSLSESRLSAATGVERALVINDMQALGHSLDHIAEEKAPLLYGGRADIDDPTRLVINVGTGFNAAHVIETPAGRIVPPAEAGHTNLPIRTEADLRLAHYLESHAPHRHGFPSIEDALSGRGVEQVHLWVAREASAEPLPDSVALMDALAREEPLALKTAEVVIRLLGAVSGNLALATLPFGGIYFAGGMARALSAHFDRFGFIEALRDKGRFAGFAESFGVSVILDDHAPLIGCAALSKERLSR